MHRTASRAHNQLPESKHVHSAATFPGHDSRHGSNHSVEKHKLAADRNVSACSPSVSDSMVLSKHPDCVNQDRTYQLRVYVDSILLNESHLTPQLAQDTSHQAPDPVTLHRFTNIYTITRQIWHSAHNTFLLKTFNTVRRARLGAKFALPSHQAMSYPKNL